MQLGRTLIVLGLVLVAAGVLVMLSDKLPFRLGKLPGDIEVHGKGGSFYFPVVTCIVISVVLTLVVWLFQRWR